MNLRLENGELSLPKDFKFEITSNHPFFSNEGTASTPSSLPASPLNCELLGFPENPNRAKRHVRKFAATLSHGIFFKNCHLIVGAAGKESGISSTLALQESELYAEIQDRKLRDIFATGQTIMVGPSWEQALNNAASAGIADYVMFPVAADAADATTPDSTGSKRLITTVLNDNINSDRTLTFSSGTITVNDENVAVSAFYGKAPFLRLSALLRKMFEYCQYEVTENVFASDATLKDIVVLHNTADILEGCVRQMNSAQSVIHFREEDMVPSMTVGDMISWIRDKFGAFVTVKDRHVSIRLLRDVSSCAPDLDMSSFLREGITLSHPSPANLRCSCQHDIEKSEPAADTLEDLVKRYPSIVECLSADSIAGTGLFHVGPLGKYYYRQTSGSTLETSMVGTDGFDYFRQKQDIDTEELSTDDSFVPMVYHKGRYMPFIGDTIRRHVDTQDKDTEAEQPLMICYVRRDDRNYGTLYHFNSSGQAIDTTAPDLTPEAMVPVFFADYRDLLLNAAPTISCQLDIPLHILVSMDPWTPKLLNHTKVLIRSLKYHLSDSGISVCQADLQVLTSYVDAEQITNPTFSSNLGWRRVTTQAYFDYGSSTGKYKNWRRVTQNDGLTDYTASDAPTWTPQYPGIKAKVRRRSVKVVEHSGYYKWFLDNGYSEYTWTHYYEEYFESYNME